jgi:hypothetical protein
VLTPSRVISLALVLVVTAVSAIINKFGALTRVGRPE